MFKGVNGGATTPLAKRTAPFFGRSASSASKSAPNTLLNAKRGYERYVALANASAMTGDAIEAENYYQHADHYFRLMKMRDL
jgi:hypothetical protein